MTTLARFLACSVLMTALVSPLPALASEEAVAPVRGSAFPEFSLPDVSGRQVSLKDFKGKAILLSFWSCYTDTCFTSVRVIEELLKQYSDRGLVAPTVCSEVPAGLENNGYEGLLKRCGMGQIVLIDKDRQLTKTFGITEFPTTFLIDRNYVVWEVLNGVHPLMTEDFRALVKSFVSE
jgi:peroxiredoxin